MKRYLKVAPVFAMLFLLGVAAYPQQPAKSMLLVTGAPYSAEEEEITGISTSMKASNPAYQHLGPWSKFTRTYRDSAGRVRIEFLGSIPEQAHIIEIRDPVSRVRYVLDSQKHIAHRSVIRAVSLIFPGAAADPIRMGLPRLPNENFVRSSEPLGTQTMEGLLAIGTRDTTTVPGGVPGSVQPHITVCEHWNVRELMIAVFAKCSDNGVTAGETTTRVTHIGREEPDPVLFQVPSDFTIVDSAPMR